MKKRIIAVLVILFLLISSFCSYRIIANADAGLLAQMSALTYAFGQSVGFNFPMTNASSGYAEDIMGDFITDYSSSSGKSLIEIFGEETLRATAGKIAAGQRAVNGVIEVLNWIKEKYDLSTIDWNLAYDDNINPGKNEDTTYAYGTSSRVYLNGTEWYSSWRAEATSINGDTQSTSLGQRNNYTYLYTEAYYDNGYVTYRFYKANTSGNIEFNWMRVIAATFNSAISGQLSEDYVEPTVLNPTQEWVGDIGAAPDTNLDDLMSDIFEGAADNNLDVDGEIIDGPVPPEPVPTWTPVDDVIDGINQGGEVITDIGNDIGDISGHLDDIGDQLDDVTGALEGVNQGIQNQTGVISGAIDQAAQDVVDAIGEQTSALDEALSGTAEGVQDIAEALEDETINWRKFDLRGLFPFCIPFDIYNMLEALDASPTAPHVQLPFVIESMNFSYTIDLDFSDFDQVAAVMRQMELIAYAIALAWATSKVIKW